MQRPNVRNRLVAIATTALAHRLTGAVTYKGRGLSFLSAWQVGPRWIKEGARSMPLAHMPMNGIYRLLRLTGIVAVLVTGAAPAVSAYPIDPNWSPPTTV